MFCRYLGIGWPSGTDDEPSYLVDRRDEAPLYRQNEHVHIGVERVNEPERFSLTMEASNAHPRLHARSRSFVEYPYALYVLLRNIPLKILLRVI